MNRWKIIFPIVILGIILFLDWQDRRELLLIGKALDYPVDDINTVIVKDGKTSKEILTLTNSDPIFFRQIYSGFHIKLNWFERRKLLKNDPAYEIEFFIIDEIYYSMNIYKVEEDQISLLPVHEDDGISKFDFIYSPDGENTYIFVRKETPHLLPVKEEFKELLNMIISK
ncbi:hypothetical protein [Fervidibacillus halotolerans]|uniref:Uncharacterized protein n=1 Tax=Fervidibacillus halotolerans TaxID=2980027 RepID=A0A9E8RXI1_9BACI|nr:hypothetical protein [Fervidibacillus halotolerans]WAA12795.1 hypothetical protein OE105_01230 [Fervidibacillus halotolerans]